jgi:hypothetical protein
MILKLCLKHFYLYFWEEKIMKVSIGVVALNEEKTLPSLFEDFKLQTYPHDEIEIILVDGISTDNTKEIMQTFKDNNDFLEVKILDNPKKIQSAGWNIVIKNFTGDVLVRIDAHSSIPRDFIEKNVKNIKSGEDVSGGKRPNIIDENTAYKRMLLEAESSMFGSSIAPFRNASGKKYVKSMFHAMYKREVLEKVGFFNEKLLRTEDNEFHYRIRKAGYKLCYNDNIVSYQHTRNSLLKMIKQKKANGMWIGLTTAVCPECLNLYHYIPFAFLVALFISIISLFFTKYLFLLVFGSYLIVNVLMSLSSIIKGKFNVYNLLLPIVFFLLHISYGYGTLVGFLKIPSFLKTYNKED